MIEATVADCTTIQRSVGLLNDGSMVDGYKKGSKLAGWEYLPNGVGKDPWTTYSPTIFVQVVGRNAPKRAKRSMKQALAWHKNMRQKESNTSA